MYSTVTVDLPLIVCINVTQLSEVTQEDSIYEEMDPTVVPGELTLEEFVKNFDHTLPQQVCFVCNMNLVEIMCNVCDSRTYELGANKSCMQLPVVKRILMAGDLLTNFLCSSRA